MHSTPYIERIPEGGKREKGIKNVFEKIMADSRWEGDSRGRGRMYTYG